MLKIEPAVWGLLPGMRIVVVEAGALISYVPVTALSDALDARCEELRASWDHPNPQSHPRLAPWRQAMKTIGAGKKQTCSIESLVRRVLKGERPPDVGPLVDLYHLVSLRHLVPAGGWDADDLEYFLDAELELRRTRAGDRFRPLGAAEGEDVDVPPGELAYAADDQILTRHFVWRQSEDAKITPETARVILVAEILPELDDEVVGEVCDSFTELFGEHFAAESRISVLSG